MISDEAVRVATDRILAGMHGNRPPWEIALDALEAAEPHMQPATRGRRRLVDIRGVMHDALCDRDRCHPDCPERLRRRALRP